MSDHVTTCAEHMDSGVRSIQLPQQKQSPASFPHGLTTVYNKFGVNMKLVIYAGSLGAHINNWYFNLIGFFHR